MSPPTDIPTSAAAGGATTNPTALPPMQNISEPYPVSLAQTRTQTQSPPPTVHTPVLIVGGSLVGLSAAMFLAWRGIARPIVVERHAGSSAHPRAIGYTPRTLELFRAVGGSLVAEDGGIKQVAPSFRLRRTRVSSLEAGLQAGEWGVERKWTPGGKEGAGKGKEEGDGEKEKEKEKPSGTTSAGETKKAPNGPPAAAAIEYSPCSGAAIAQDKLEPLLRERAQELGAEVRGRTELLSLRQDAAGVTALVRERDGEQNEYAIRAQYVIAADGARSGVREALGIPRKGRGHIKTVRSVLFRAPALEPYLASGFSQFEIHQEGEGGLQAFLTTYMDGRWVLIFADEVERGEEGLRDAVFQAAGRRDFAVEIVTTGRWELTGLIAEQYGAGRIFLAGDAAHTLPPTRGGYGANTGIEDVHNLAWKLEAVLSGKSDAALLDTYSAERQPIGRLRHQQTFARPDYAAEAQGIADGEPILDDIAMEVGQLHRSSAVIGASDSELPPARKPDEWAGQPGTRAPHLWITRGAVAATAVNDQRLSTLDLFQKSWVLLAEDEQWSSAAAEAQDRLGIEVEFIHVGTAVRFVNDEAFRGTFGLGEGGASLVRPDGYIAWRSLNLPRSPSDVFNRALAQVSCATGNASTNGSEKH